MNEIIQKYVSKVIYICNLYKTLLETHGDIEYIFTSSLMKELEHLVQLKHEIGYDTDIDFLKNDVPFIGFKLIDGRLRGDFNAAKMQGSKWISQFFESVNSGCKVSTYKFELGCLLFALASQVCSDVKVA